MPLNRGAYNWKRTNLYGESCLLCAWERDCTHPHLASPRATRLEAALDVVLKPTSCSFAIHLYPVYGLSRQGI